MRLLIVKLLWFILKEILRVCCIILGGIYTYFSTGFTLVRHYFQMPKIEGENGEPPHITLYSLYMHQLDWYGYQQKEKAEKEKQREEDRKPICYPHYWTVKSGKAKPEKFDKVVVLKTPIPINEGDFIGYIGHNNSFEDHMLIPKKFSLPEVKRISDEKLKLQGHFEFFTCNDFDSFMQKTQNLATKLPENQKSLIMFDKGIKLIADYKKPSTTTDNNNTVYFPRIISPTFLQTEEKVTGNGKAETWANITAGNDKYGVIDGWVNISKNGNHYVEQNVKQVSPWEWLGFNTIEDKSTIGQSVDKIRQNRKMTLDVADYTDVMSTLNNILTETPMNQRQATTTPALTPQQFKNGLLTPWTAAMIGRLVVKYESEWYADESLSKWNELDDLHQNEYEEHKQTINDELDRCNITQQADRDRPLNLLEKNHQCFIDKWQIEKQDRIKPSLWWHEVLNGQKESSEAEKLSNDGQAWHFHPVGMMIFLKK